MKKKLIIEASHISLNSGAFSLLLKFINVLETQNIISDIYISKKNVSDALNKLNYSNSNIILTNTFKTILRYFSKRESVFYFNNLPPFRSCGRSILYFHNELILTNSVLSTGSLKFFIYKIWLFLFSEKIDFVACQTENIKNKLEKLGLNRVNKIPFYHSLSSYRVEKKEIKYDFCCITSDAQHKNNESLLKAIEILSSNRTFTFAITIPFDTTNKYLLKKIDYINKKGKRNIVYNLGRLNLNEVRDVYLKSSALVFPSLRESFGLPLIEAVELGLKVLTANKPYSHEVLENPILFNPKNIVDIKTKMDQYLDGKFCNVKQQIKIKNNIQSIINHLINV